MEVRRVFTDLPEVVMASVLPVAEAVAMTRGATDSSYLFVTCVSKGDLPASSTSLDRGL